jgi:DNA-binding MarR family transcriptional regulator
LAKLLYVHPSTLSGILKRLQRQGLVRRRLDPRDARRFLLSLTDKGRLLDVETEGTIEATVQRVLKQAKASQIEAAGGLLRSLAESLGALDLEQV